LEKRREKKRKEKIINTVWKKWYAKWNPYIIGIGLIVFVGLNIFFSLSPFVAFYKWMKVLELVFFGFYIIKTKPSLHSITYCLSLAILFSSLLAIAQFIFQHSLGGIFWFFGERTFSSDTVGIAQINLCSLFSPSTCHISLRPYATFPHPNVLGGFLAVTLPLTFWLSDDKTFLVSKKYFSIIKWSIVTVGLIALFLTFSRSAWIVACVGIVFSVLRTGKKSFVYVCGGLVLVLGLLVFPLFKDLTSQNESVYLRNDLNAVSLNMWQSSPLIGTGLGNFLVRLPEYYSSRQIFFLQPVHNIYLLLLSETGLLGLCAFLLFVALIIRKKMWRMKKMEGVSLFYFFALVLFLLLGLVDHYPLTLQQGVLFLTLLLAVCFL